MPANEQKVWNSISDELRKLFHVMSAPEIENYIQGYKSVKDKRNRAHEMRARDPPPTDYNKAVISKFGTRQKAIKAITKEVQHKVEQEFGVTPERRIEDTNYRIDLYDEDAKICYEFALGDGTEFFKDVLKALMIGAKKLVVFSRSYPNPWGMVGYGYIKRQWSMMREKIELNVEIIEFVSNKFYP